MTNPQLPSCRNLDMYRLVTVRGWKQIDVARSFAVSPVRVCQIVSHVHDWVNQSLPVWFFPDRHDLRFLAALAYENIRILDQEADPERVRFLAPGWTYKRENRIASLTASQPLQTPPPDDAPRSAASTMPHPAETLSPAPALDPLHNHSHYDPELSPPPLNSMSASFADAIAATPGDTTNIANPRLLQLAHRFAQILILWKKSQRHASPPHGTAAIPSERIARHETSPVIMSS